MSNCRHANRKSPLNISQTANNGLQIIHFISATHYVRTTSDVPSFETVHKFGNKRTINLLMHRAYYALFLWYGETLTVGIIHAQRQRIKARFHTVSQSVRNGFRWLTCYIIE